MKYIPHKYQQTATDFILSHPSAGLFLEMGLGKTVATLTAIKELIYDRLEVARVLVIAPVRVAENTWTDEANKWDHLKDLKFSKIIGSASQREMAAMDPDADIFLLGRENTKWLIDFFRKKKCWPYDMVVIDELSSFKSCDSKRFRALRVILPLVKRIVGLTGTPSPNGLMDLWSEIYLLDRGERLGKTITSYRMNYFIPGRTNGYVVYDYIPKQGADKIIQDNIADICLSMKSEDYLTLPDKIMNTVCIKLSEAERKQYEEFEKNQIMQLDEDHAIIALSAAAVSNKLLQMANGSVYDNDRNVIHCHDKKLEALEDILEFNNEPVLVFYNFKHDIARLYKHFGEYKPRTLDTPNDLKDWNAGKIRLLFAHPASTGHGLNIQAGGHIIVWFGLTWNLELYLQANARLYRQGQKEAVIIHHLVAEGTIDEEVMKALSRKNAGQNALLEALKERREKYAN